MVRQVRECVDPLKRVIVDHEKVSEYSENLSAIREILHTKEVWDRITPVVDFLKRNVSDHFEFEERVVFPAILSEIGTPEARELILELQEQHETMLKELQRFRKMVPDNAVPSLDRKTNVRLYGIVRSITDALLKHASKEDDELLPILRGNRNIFDSRDAL